MSSSAAALVPVTLSVESVVATFWGSVIERAFKHKQHPEGFFIEIQIGDLAPKEMCLTVGLWRALSVYIQRTQLAQPTEVPDREVPIEVYHAAMVSDFGDTGGPMQYLRVTIEHRRILIILEGYDLSMVRRSS